MNGETMKKRPIIIDCDPGVDDALALLLARQIESFDIRAVTTAAGNVELEKTTENALRLCAFCGLDAPVCAGAAGPLYGEARTGKYVHGEGGMGGAELPPTEKKLCDIAAWEMIYQEAKKQDGELEIIALGPLTNLALALMKYKELPSLIKRIVLMGGAATCGNVTPAAEFNFYADAEAAAMVFDAGIPVYMCGLDVTLQAYFTEEQLRDMGKMGSEQASFLCEALQMALRFSQQHGLPGVGLHDPLAVLYAEDDSIFTTHRCGVKIETQGRITRGKSVTDLYSDKKMDERNAFVVTGLDLEAFRARLLALMARYGQN